MRYPAPARGRIAQKGKRLINDCMRSLSPFAAAGGGKMQDVPEPGFNKLLQDAVDQGKIVLIPTPTPPRQRRTERTDTIPPLRDRDAASLAVVLCLLFNLRRSESQILMKLATQDYATIKELHAAANHDEQTVAASSMTVLISGLRKKLAPHGLEITTLRGFGYGLRKESREKICRRLAKYDAGLLSTTQPELNVE
jgi:hypothetical protein